MLVPGSHKLFYRWEGAYGLSRARIEHCIAGQFLILKLTLAHESGNLTFRLFDRLSGHGEHRSLSKAHVARTPTFCSLVVATWA